jgi:KamA family protein
LTCLTPSHSTLTRAGWGEGMAARFAYFTPKDLPLLAKRAGLSEEQLLLVRAVAEVLPFRTNCYVLDELIDWSAAPDDPIYRLVFPQEEMLPASDLVPIADLLRNEAPQRDITAAVNRIRAKLNPHPAGQLEFNVPVFEGRPMAGVQHKYPETVLFFPKQGQTCHAYCTYCFRWPQFVGDPDLRIAGSDIELLTRYIRAQPRVTNVLITGGDPMIMRQHVLRRYVDPLLRLEQLESIRIGTKALAYWPYRFTTDADADDMLRLFERVVRAGKDLSFMAHFSHPRELAPTVVHDAVRRVRDSGASIRTQAPLMRSINDAAPTWAEMWRRQVRMGMVPYYMFVERDTGPLDYFKVGLGRAVTIFGEAFRDISGLCRTVRGPSMSTMCGKVCIDGVAEVRGEKVFVLHYIQCREPDLVNRPFFAKYDPHATWFSDLVPALGGQFPMASTGSGEQTFVRKGLT